MLILFPGPGRLRCRGKISFPDFNYAADSTTSDAADGVRNLTCKDLTDLTNFYAKDRQ